MNINVIVVVLCRKPPKLPDNTTVLEVNSTEIEVADGDNITDLCASGHELPGGHREQYLQCVRGSSWHPQEAQSCQSKFTEDFSS